MLKTNTLNVAVKFGDTVVVPTVLTKETWISLGVKLDSSLSMERQVNSVKQKCCWTLHNMRIIRCFLDKETKIMMVKQLIIMRVDYCNVLYINLPKKTLKRLQSILNSCIRYIYKVRDYKQDLTPLYKDAHILPIQQRIMFKVSLLCFKIVNGMAPQYMEHMVTLDTPHGNHTGTRNRPVHDLHRLKVLPLPKTLIGTRRFSYQAPLTWNALPLSIRALPSIDAFKKSLKTHLFHALDPR